MIELETTLSVVYVLTNSAMPGLVKIGKTPWPIERTLLTTGMTAAGIESLFQKQKRLDTPHLAVQYQPTRESTFWRT